MRMFGHLGRYSANHRAATVVQRDTVMHVDGGECLAEGGRECQKPLYPSL